MSVAREGADLRLSIGTAQLLVESTTGWARYCQVAGTEVVRAIYAAVRDRNWGTVPAVVGPMSVEESADRIMLRFETRATRHEIDYAWTTTITLTPSSLEYHFDGVAKSEFARNRIGLCVHHPPEIVLATTHVTHASGWTESLVIPGQISPHQPVSDIRALLFESANSRVAFEFTGDVFEMEDQRNWTDASFKTYCTPLDIPFPVAVKAGDRCEQRVRVRFTTGTQETCFFVGSTGSRATKLRHQWPLKIGASLSSLHHSTQAIAQLRSLKLDHIRIESRLDRADWQAELARDHALASSIAPVWHAIFGEGDAMRTAIAQSLRMGTSRLLLFDSTGLGRPNSVGELAGLAAGKASVAIGTDAFFAQLNRNPPLVTDLWCDGLVFSANPQVHASDDRSLMENLSGLGAVAASAGAFAADRDDFGVIVSPLTLRPRWHPAATRPEPLEQQLEHSTDPRQHTELVGLWTEAALEQLAENGVAAVTLFETIGPRGLLQADGTHSPASRVVAKRVKIS